MNLSQRLQQLAAAGETVLSEATLTRAAAEPWMTVPLGAQLVKGRDTPVVAFKIDRRRGDTRPRVPDVTAGGPHDTETGRSLSRRRHGDALIVDGVRKTFEAENAPVRALRGVDLDRHHAASSSR